jgi:photosystem II stability/assembly factor-like uncharacterized protein
MRKSSHLNLLILFLFVIFLNTRCTKSDTTSSGNYTGWAVGQTSNGYGTILNTQNDGFDWFRQQVSTLAPDVSLNDIKAFTSLEAWAVGGVVNGYGLILHTLDGGISWERMGTLNTVPNADLMAVLVIDAQTVWIAGKSNRVLYTTDKGLTWQNVRLDSASQVNFTSITGSGIKNIWVSGEPVSRNPGDSVAIIVHSADGGMSWFNQGLLDTLPGMIHNIFALDDSTLYAAADQYIYKSTNGGSKWQVVFSWPNNRINAVCAEDINNIWAVGNNDAIFHSINAGYQWDTIRPQVRGNNLLGVTANGVAQKVWIVGANAAGVGKGIILYTNNDGETWFLEDYPVETGIFKISFPPTTP